MYLEQSFLSIHYDRRSVSGDGCIWGRLGSAGRAAVTSAAHAPIAPGVHPIHPAYLIIWKRMPVATLIIFWKRRCDEIRREGTRTTYILFSQTFKLLPIEIIIINFAIVAITSKSINVIS